MVGVPERSQSGLATLSMVGISGGEESELCCKVEGGGGGGAVKVGEQVVDQGVR